ncbi:MAG: PAS domain-containing protein [Desulfobacteraceae bacterium]|nr:PAS domain-containing protein [Desulfobacteraceae bacterium]
MAKNQNSELKENSLDISKLILVNDNVSLDVDFESFIDRIPAGVAVLDSRRRILFMNRALEALTGFSREQVKDIPCHMVLRHRACLKRCPALKMKADAQTVMFESDLINRDRSLLPVNISIGPLKDMEGNLAGFIETIEDLRPVREFSMVAAKSYSFADMVGRSPEMEKIFNILPALALNDSSILVTGETGAGKDLLAEAVHNASTRAKGPFIKVNCGAFPETLLESELFGHTKGAFTGAMENKPGRFRLAHGGTLYLTEIGDLPLPLQVKLLTFLDDRVVYPLGSTKGFQADVRVIAATHRKLEQMVKEQRFRQDLLFRLNVVRIHIPPLRARDGDVRLLMDHFLNVLNDRLGKNVHLFSEKALDILLFYTYPGNVRELRNIIEYAVNICQGNKILPDHLPAYLLETANISTQNNFSGKIGSRQDQRFHPVAESIHSGTTWDNVERKMIINALIKAGGKRSKAAEILGWGRSTLWRKMKQYDIYAK